MEMEANAPKSADLDLLMAPLGALSLFTSTLRLALACRGARPEEWRRRRHWRRLRWWHKKTIEEI